MIIIGFAMFTGWAFLLLRMVDLGGSWRDVGIILGVLTTGIVPVLVVALIRHWYPNFLTTVEVPARTRHWFARQGEERDVPVARLEMEG
jgi:hypothetical protein